ncbi:flagellar hook-associated protein FlgK [Planctomicrobium sp. SH668]|uniref:flagellar hook-associated protein FlgK n=1 Tax=Planctomicrobium sp. SH668 TaxID=3448126 RepID=UPI003F5C8E4D
MLIYNIGISAMQANQAALQTISNNIANANTDGYHRQRITLAENRPFTQGGFQFGAGVSVASLQRMVSAAANQSLTLNRSDLGNTQARLSAIQAIEGLVTPSSGSLSAAVSQYFNAFEKLSVTPEHSTLRQEVIAAADSVAQQITAIHTGLDRLQSQQTQAIHETVNRVNALTTQISQLEQEIKLSRLQGSEPATLLDQRDLAISNLSELVDISVGSFRSDDSTLVVAGGWLVVGDRPPQLSVMQGPNGEVQLMLGNMGPVTPASGKLAGEITSLKSLIPDVRSKFLEWTSAFISGANSAQATGLGLNGPLPMIAGGYPIDDSTIPLAQAKTLLPIQSGTLSLSVTDGVTGERRLHQIDVNPQRDSLSDVIVKLNSIPNLKAELISGRLRISGESGASIDFAGRPESPVNRSSLSGTTVPAVAGVYSGLQNTDFSFVAQSTGEVGVSSGLTLHVINKTTGQLVKILDVGDGYRAGQPISIGDGLSIELSAGTFVSGDEFSVQAIANPDQSGLLTGLGIGGLFQTTDLRTISVNSEVAKNPSLLAAGRTEHPGDATQIDRIAQFRAMKIFSSGTETLEERLHSTISETGIVVNAQQLQVKQLESQQQQLRSQQDAVSGVDPNEELMAMLQFQRAFQANARFMSSVNTALDDLLRLIA